MWNRAWMLGLSLVALTLFVPASTFAHGTATLCVKANDEVQECGEGHTCEIFAQVSTEIGVCQEANTAYRTCDKRRGDEDCAGGQECKIGTVDPHIGACIGDEEAVHGDGHDHDHDSSCQSARGQGAPATGLMFMLVAGVCLARRRRR